MSLRIKSYGQSILEYIVIIIIVIAVLIVIGVYYRRSLQGKYRQAAEVLGGGELYTPPAL
jgi:hypothetical protein